MWLDFLMGQPNNVGAFTLFVVWLHGGSSPSFH
ncbi:MAG: hypothetical protein MAG451_00992 [Anaerolineales bacterium]|nr:hypothetical protein [Anaerolineales bacterium]